MRGERLYYSIASGSSGNCGVYVDGGTAILIDAGVSFRKIKLGIEKVKLGFEDISAVLITHEHTDHIKGLPMLLKKTDIPVFASGGTINALMGKGMADCGKINRIRGEGAFFVGGIRVTPFDTPHDAAESLGFVLKTERFKFGYATDLGFVPQSVIKKLLGSEAVVLESNHDPEMLEMGPYAYPLKRRVAGPGGHLSNPDSAIVAKELVKNGTRTIILAHLSSQNNKPEIAYQQVISALKGKPECAVYVAPKDQMEAPVVLEEAMPCLMSG